MGRRSRRARITTALAVAFLFSSAPHADEKELQPWEDESCAFEKTDLNLEPEALVKAFVTRDGRGDFLRTDPWFERAVACPGHLGGPDGATVVLGVEIENGELTTDSATFRASYREVGWISSGGEDGTRNTFNAEPKRITGTFRVIRTPFGWKLEKFRWLMLTPGGARKATSGRGWVDGDREKFARAIHGH